MPALDGVSVSLSTVADADGYNRSVAGIQIEAIRAGPGSGENAVLAIQDDRFVSSSCRFGFPMFSRTTVGDDRMIVAHINSTVPGSRWCGIDLEPGAVLIYGPGVEHAAVNNPGLSFTFVTTTLKCLQAQAEQLRSSIDLPERGRVRALRPRAGTRAVGDAFTAMTGAAAAGAVPSGRLRDEVLRSIIETLSVDATVMLPGNAASTINRHRIVHACIDYAEAIGRIPSVTELCVVAHVSERTLRRAFIDEFDLPPSQFLLAWALGQANRRLRNADENETVTDVALGLGFSHLGRFAGSYKHLFGERPSMTLRSSPARD